MDPSEQSSPEPMDLNTPPASTPDTDPSTETISKTEVLMAASTAACSRSSSRAPKTRRPHSERQKAKAREMGPRLQNRTKALGVSARIFAMSAYWDPTHQLFHVMVHLPAGEEPPDISKLMMDALAKDRAKRARWRRRRLDGAAAQESNEMEIDKMKNETLAM